MARFSKRCTLPVAPAEAFAWHARPGALERLLPPWQRVRVLERSADGLAEGTRVALELRWGPLRSRWIARHRAVEADRSFVDEQEHGPFATWRHTHRFLPGEGGCVLEDEVEYGLPLGPLGAVLGGRAVQRALKRTFSFRHARTAADLVRHHRTAGERRHVVVTGASGLIGAALTAFLRSGGHRVTTLVRRRPREGWDEAFWDPSAGAVDAAALEGADAVVHLAGENIGGGRWTAARRRSILDSRVRGTELLAHTLAGLAHPPPVLVAASAVGFYGDRGREEVDEDTGPGRGFLADVCRAWEQACAPASEAGLRVVNARFGMVLSASGGALARMLPAFRAGLGGPMGRGEQAVSWVALDDAVGAVLFAISKATVAGPVNVVAPGAVSNRDLARSLGRVLRRPARLPVPGPAIRLAFGAMGDELLLAGARVRPGRLQAAGFTFLYPALEAALRLELGRL